MKKIRNSMLVVAVTMFVIVAIALTQMKTTTTARGVADIKAYTGGFSLIDQENAQTAANESNARTDAGASEEDKGNTSGGSGSSSTTNSSNSTSSVLTSGAASNDISLTSKGNTSVNTTNTTGEMPKTGENDTVLFAMVGAVVIGAVAFIRAKSVRVK